MTAIRNFLNAIWQRVLEEPVYTQAMVQGAIGLATAFGLGWSAAQVAAVMVFTAGVLAWLTRKAVTPVAAPVLPENTTVTVTTPIGTPDRVVTT